MLRRVKILRHIFKFHGLKESFQFAFTGLGYLFLYHRNMRIIFILGILALFLGFYFDLRGLELISLCITVTLVFMAEIFNTAIEMGMNMLTVKYHTRIKIIKDIAAAVVLLASINAIAVGYIIFSKRIFR